MSTATISIAIEAQTATLKKGFDEARAAIKGLDAGMSNHVAMGLAKFQVGWAAARGAISAVTGALSSMKQTMDEMGEMEEWSQRLGMSADALTVLGYAAEQTGASQETMNRALEKLQKTLGEAAAGLQGARAKFEGLGLSVKDVLSLTPDQQFAAIAAAIQNVGSTAERTKIAMDLFGKSGGELNNLLAEGTEGLKKYGEEAKKLGLLLGNARAGVEAAGDAMNALNRSWGALKQRLAIGLAEPLAAAAGGLAKFLGWAQGFDYDKQYHIVGSTQYLAKKAAQEAQKQMKETTKVAETAVERIRTKFAEIPKPIDFVTPGIGAVTRGTVAGFSALQEANRARVDADRRHKEEIAWLKRIDDSVKAGRVTLTAVGLGT